MKVSARLLAAPGFWQRSMDEFRRLSNAAIKLEGIRKPDKPLELWNFSEPESVETCVDMSDSDIGGYSESKLVHIPKSSSEPAHALFTGHISNKLPHDELEVERTGYAAFRTQDRPSTLFGKSFWNVDTYRYLALRIKTDGRKYKVNVQTESLVYSDLHQHRLYSRFPGRWETIVIKWSDFVRTNHGNVVEPQSEMMREKIRTIGIGLTDRVAGPFTLRVARIWTTNYLTSEEVDASTNDIQLAPRSISGGTATSSTAGAHSKIRH